MADRESLKKQIVAAFSGNRYPGDGCLKGSTEGTEPYLLEQEFKGKVDWRLLDAAFLDSAPDGFASALSFFSDEAFRFYLPAYLIADIDGQLHHTDVLFYLCHGFDDATKDQHVNPRRYGARTWFDTARYKFAMFTQPEVAAIVAYLNYKLASNTIVDFEQQQLKQALRNYWAGQNK